MTKHELQTSLRRLTGELEIAQSPAWRRNSGLDRHQREVAQDLAVSVYAVDVVLQKKLYEEEIQ